MGHTRTSVKSLTNKIDHVKIDYQVKKTKQRNQTKSITFFFFFEMYEPTCKGSGKLGKHAHYQNTREGELNSNGIKIF